MTLAKITVDTYLLLLVVKHAKSGPLKRLISTHEHPQTTKIRVLGIITTVEIRMVNLEACGATQQIQTPDGSIVTLVQHVHLVAEAVGCSLSYSNEVEHVEEVD